MAVSVVGDQIGDFSINIDPFVGFTSGEGLGDTLESFSPT
jgi:hypothetical protein